MAFPLSAYKRTLPVHLCPRPQPKVNVDKSCFENQSKLQITALFLSEIQILIDFYTLTWQKTWLFATQLVQLQVWPKNTALFRFRRK